MLCSAHAGRSPRLTSHAPVTSLRPDEDWSAPALLLRLCAQGNRAAFRRLYELYAPQMHGIALRLTRSRSLAADAMHDAWLLVWQRAADFDPARGSAEAWLIALVRYRALDIMRRRRREMPLPESGAEEAEAAPMAEEPVRSEDLRRCLGTLEEERRQMVVLAFVAGLSHAELAAQLGQKLGTVKSTIRRALLSLRRCLDE